MIRTPRVSFPGSLYSQSVFLPTGRLDINVDSTELPLEKLTGFAARNNVKRGFLFVSKVLGKHYPVRPAIMHETHIRLARKITGLTLAEPVLFIGMAETATALAHGIFDAFMGLERGTEGLFLQTTRYRLTQLEALTFEEQHSHASTHFLHIPDTTEKQRLFSTARTIVLIDDEMSTGNTFVHLVQAIKSRNRSLKQLVCVTLTNWLAQERQVELAQRLSFPVDFIQLLSGSYKYIPDTTFHYGPLPHAQRKSAPHEAPVNSQGGRQGISAFSSIDCRPVLKRLTWLKPRQRILVLGTGEFMYSPYRLALELERQGYAVKFQATTRSPLLLGGDIVHTRSFTDNYGENIDNFLYNVHDDHYDHILLLHETPSPPYELLEALGAKAMRWEEQ